MDAAHFVLGLFICHVWSLVRKFLPPGAGRNRINVLGAVNAITKEIAFIHNTDYINAEVILEFLKKLRKEYCSPKPNFRQNHHYRQIENERISKFY